MSFNCQMRLCGIIWQLLSSWDLFSSLKFEWAEVRGGVSLFGALGKPPPSPLLPSHLCQQLQKGCGVQNIQIPCYAGRVVGGPHAALHKIPPWEVSMSPISESATGWSNFPGRNGTAFLWKALRDIPSKSLAAVLATKCYVILTSINFGTQSINKCHTSSHFDSLQSQNVMKFKGYKYFARKDICFNLLSLIILLFC